jgi:hypothetical protein
MGEKTTIISEQVKEIKKDKLLLYGAGYKDTTILMTRYFFIENLRKTFKKVVKRTPFQKHLNIRKMFILVDKGRKKHAQ